MERHIYVLCYICYVMFVIFSTVNWDGINIEIKGGNKTLTKKIILYRAARQKNMLCILSVKVPPAPPSLPYICNLYQSLQFVRHAPIIGQAQNFTEIGKNWTVIKDDQQLTVSC